MGTFHPLYHQARGYIGRPVFVHHVTGRVYHGTVVSVQPGGLYIMQHQPGTRLVSSEQEANYPSHASGETSNVHLDATLVYSPLGYFAFGALTGLTLGAAAGYLW